MGSLVQLWLPTDLDEKVREICHKQKCRIGEGIQDILRRNLDQPKNGTSSSQLNNSKNGSSEQERNSSEADAGADKKNYDYSKEHRTMPEQSAPASAEAAKPLASSNKKFSLKRGA